MFKKLFYSMMIVMSMSLYAQTSPTKTGEVTIIEPVQFTPVKSTPKASTVAPFQQPEHSKFDGIIAGLIIVLAMAIGIKCFISLYNRVTEDLE